MTRRMRTSTAGLELIKSFEGFRARATQLPNGLWTIGYGHTKAAKQGLRMTPSDGEAVLREYDLPRFERALLSLVMAPLNQHEFDALISFAFNIGGKAFANSRVLTLLNAGERLAAAEAMYGWRKALLNGRLVIVDALVRRRAAEVALFLKSPSGNPVASSVMVRPVLDTGMALVKPARVAPRAEKPAARPERVLLENDARLTRILGEPAASKPPKNDADDEPPFNPGPTPDEITRAISALANGDDLPPIETRYEQPLGEETKDEDAPKNTVDDLPDLPQSIIDGQERCAVAIDDLEKASVDPEIVAQAIKDAEAAETNRQNAPARPGVIGRVGLGVTGLVLASFGLTRAVGNAQSDNATEMAQYLSTGSLVFGGFFILLAVYLGLRGRLAELN